MASSAPVAEEAAGEAFRRAFPYRDSSEEAVGEVDQAS